MTIQQYCERTGRKLKLVKQQCFRMNLGIMEKGRKILSEDDVSRLDDVGKWDKAYTLAQYARDTGRKYATVVNIAKKHNIGTLMKINNIMVRSLSPSDIAELDRRKRQYETVDGVIKEVRK